jgi:D-glycero-D-manno-heptose 1,7-bisphosphate phosphatase
MPDRRAAVRTVFLDRDGVLNRKAPEGEYVSTWDEFAFLPGAVAAVAALTRAGHRVVVVTNQRGVALGRVDPAALEDIHARMRAQIAAAGGRVDAVYHCPHDKGECECRKPRPGMFLQAARELPGLRLEESAVVGDRASDMQAAAS